MCALVLAAPAAALAREPVISYVDGAGVFRLYDEETESDVSPPPPVPVFDTAQFRYGMSMNAKDAAGNRSLPGLLEFRVLRPKQPPR